MHRKLRAGMVGGGRDAFIGGVHRMAMQLDGQIELVAGAFSSDREKSKTAGKDLFLAPARVYSDYQTMAAEEAKLPAGQRVDFVSVVTPNRLHAPVCTAFLEAGFNLVCDKPLALNLAEALTLREAVRKSGRIFVLTHNYTGYPMVREARELIKSGELGEIRKVVSEYSQGWLSYPLEREGQKQATWRTDPQQAGSTGCLGDIGTHAEHLVRYITRLQIEELCAEFTTFVPGRRLEDDANLLIRYRGGAKGVLISSQISAGEDNGLTIRIYGSKGALAWRQENPNQMTVQPNDGPRTLLRAGGEYLSPPARRCTRLPAGHPEGFIEAFANIYREAARAIGAEIEGKAMPPDCDFPGIDDGVAGMAFTETAITSARAGGVWTKILSH